MSSQKPLDDAERRLAAVTAHVIAKAQDSGLPDVPDKLVTLQAILLLARAHLELIERVEQLHRAVGGLEELAERRRALVAQVRSIQGSVDQIARIAIKTALHETEVVGPLPAAVTSGAGLLAIYCRVMAETEDVFVKYESCVVRQWDSMAGCWFDCTGAVDREEALRVWTDRTGGGTHHVFYDLNLNLRAQSVDSDGYYRIFPGTPSGEVPR